MPATFTAQLKLDGFKFNSDARVVIEAYRGSGGLWIGYDWGCVSALRKPPTATLDGFESVEGLLFRVRVIAVHEPHQILGEADKIPFVPVGEAPTNKQPLIKTLPAELGDLVWDVNFDDETPVLRVNRSLGNWQVVAYDKAFRALVYPAVLREILTRILIVDNWTGDSEDDDWRVKWIKFAHKLAPGYDDSIFDESGKWEFIDASVLAVAREISAADCFLNHLNPNPERT
ncbi:MAG: hypothetical protein KDK74_14755 [Cephaloticoccus sp.]|nr:hypothetical protein [Cephaloticoccus sp.]